MDSLEISLFEEIDACYIYDHDSLIKHYPKYNQTKKKLKVKMGCPTVVYDYLCYKVNDGPMLLDDINYATTENGIGKVMTSVYFDHTILELSKNYVFVDHENHVLCESYIIEFVHDATGNYLREGNMVMKIFMSLKHLSLS